jgi:hypothetical protein
MAGRPRCAVCKKIFPTARKKLGYETCTKHGDSKHNFTVAIPYSKGAYQYIHDPMDLHFTNAKGVR